MALADSQLLERFAQGQRRALARLLTYAEQGRAPKLPTGTLNSSRKSALVVGITGSGGAGKSTLIARLIGHLRARGTSVAVLACDPQSPVTGGALLGDRVRMSFDPADEGVFFRSMSTRGAPGGISAAAGDCIEWLRAFGYDVILVETVGVGQDQVAIRPLVERLLLLVTPGSGDEVQWEKAGVLEVADIVAVNKCDVPGAEHVIAQLKSTLSLGAEGKIPPVLGVSARSGEGIEQLWEEVVRTDGIAPT